MVPFGTIWHHLEPFGTIWNHLEPFGTIWNRNEFGTLAFSACAGVTIDQGAVLCLYEGVEMIPEAGLLTVSVDKAPYSILMMVSIVSAYRLMARRGLRTVFFYDQGFLHERGELGSISSQKEVLRQNLTPLVVGYIFTYIFRL